MMFVSIRIAAVLPTVLAIGLAATACTTPAIHPEPFQLGGSYSLLNSVSELPITDRNGRNVFPDTWESDNSIVATLGVVLRRAVESPRRLTITETDSALTLSADQEQRLVFYRDGRASSDLITSAGKYECRASWNGSSLIVEHFLDGHTHVTETYERSEDQRLLAVTVVLDDSRLPRPLTSRRVYRAAEVVARSTDATS